MKRKMKRNSKYFSDEETPRKVTQRKSFLPTIPTDSSDEEQIPQVPKIRKSLNLTERTESNSLTSPNNQTLVESVEEPLYTFKDLFKSVKRIESKSDISLLSKI